MKNILLAISISLISSISYAQSIPENYYTIPQAEKFSYGYAIFKAALINMSIQRTECLDCFFGDNDSAGGFGIGQKHKRTFGTKLPSFNIYQRFGHHSADKGFVFELENYWNHIDESKQNDFEEFGGASMSLNSFSFRLGISNKNGLDFGIIHLNQKFQKADLLNLDELFPLEEINVFRSYSMEHKMLGLYLKANRIRPKNGKQTMKLIFDLAIYFPYQSTYTSSYNDFFISNGEVIPAKSWQPSGQVGLTFTSFDVSSLDPKPIYWLFELRGNYINRNYETQDYGFEEVEVADQHLIQMSANIGIGLRW